MLYLRPRDIWLKKNLRETSGVSVLQKTPSIRFGEPLFSRLTSFQPKPGNGVVFLFYKDFAPTELLLIGIKLFEYVSSTYDRQVSGEKKSP
jgi:hypothetical protein